MKVNNHSAPQAHQANAAKEAQEAKHQREVRRSESSEPREVDFSSVKTDISPKAAEFAKAKEIASATPDVREAKIAELKRRIENKEYNVEPEAIADKMVDEHLKTLGIGG